MTDMESLKKVLADHGWHLSEDGLAKCLALCVERNLKPSWKNVEHVALDLDLRSIGEQVLSEDIARNLKHEVEGPIVFQVQKIKNVALPTTKQHLTQSNRRLLRLQLTDGKLSLSAIEMEETIPNLSTQTPPGTKVKLLQKVLVQKSFLLLKMNSLQILGGTVEHLVQKWNMNKIIPDNSIRRSQEGGASGPPRFAPFGAAALAQASARQISGGNDQKAGKALSSSDGKRNRPTVSVRDETVAMSTKVDEREKMDLPSISDGGSRFPRKKIDEALGDGTSRESTSQTSGFWVGSRRGGREKGRGEEEGGGSRERQRPDRRRDREEGEERERREGGRRERGRGGRTRSGEDDYAPGKKSEQTLLSDWFDEKLNLSSKTRGRDNNFSSGGREMWREGVGGREGGERVGGREGDVFIGEAWAYEESLAMAEMEEERRRFEEKVEGRERKVERRSGGQERNRGEWEDERFARDTRGGRGRAEYTERGRRSQGRSRGRRGMEGWRERERDMIQPKNELNSGRSYHRDNYPPDYSYQKHRSEVKYEDRSWEWDYSERDDVTASHRDRRQQDSRWGVTGARETKMGLSSDREERGRGYRGRWRGREQGRYGGGGRGGSREGDSQYRESGRGRGGEGERGRGTITERGRTSSVEQPSPRDGERGNTDGRQEMRGPSIQEAHGDRSGGRGSDHISRDVETAEYSWDWVKKGAPLGARAHSRHSDW